MKHLKSLDRLPRDLPVGAPVPSPGRARRRDGWTSERRALFLDRLAEGDGVCRAAAMAGMSREGAYRLRRRDAAFARDWHCAVRAARLVKRDGFMSLLPESLRAAMERLERPDNPV